MIWLTRLRNLISDRQQKAAMVAAPIVVNPNDNEKVQLSISRLDAIRRHLEQSKNVTPERLREFRAEARLHAAYLLSRNRIDEQEHDRLLKLAGVS